jgi:hypothetical protein
LGFVDGVCADFLVVDFLCVVPVFLCDVPFFDEPEALCFVWCVALFVVGSVGVVDVPRASTGAVVSVAHRTVAVMRLR